MSSEKLQALPGEPLILVTSHTFTVFFTTVPGPAHSSLWSPARAASGCKQIGILLCCLLSHNFSPCTVLTSSSRWGNPPLLPPLSSLSLSLSIFLSALWSCSSRYLPSLSLSFFGWVLSPPQPLRSHFSPFFALLPPPTIQTPAAAQTSSTKQAEGSHTQPANSRATKSSMRPMGSSGVCVCTNQGRFFSTSGPDRRNWGQCCQSTSVWGWSLFKLSAVWISCRGLRFVVILHKGAKPNWATHMIHLIRC